MFYSELFDTGVTISTILVCFNFVLSVLLYKSWAKLEHHAGVLQEKIDNLEVTKQQLKRIKKLERLVEPKQQTPFDVFWKSNLYRLSDKK